MKEVNNAQEKTIDEKMVRNRVTRALERLIDLDGHLLEIDANERSITHKLAEYLQQEFPKYNVDCEYNRRVYNTKDIIFSDKPDEIRKKMEADLDELYSQNYELLDDLFAKRKHYPKEFLESKLEKKFTQEEVIRILKCIFGNIFPDIIIHKRGNDKNILAIEIKKGPEPKSSNKKKSREFKNDRYKLGSLTSTDDGYKYDHGLFLILKMDKPYDTTLEWYKNGNFETSYKLSEKLSEVK